MVTYKSPEEIEIIRQNCHLVCRTLALAGSMLRPGALGADIDREAESFIRDHDAVPGFKGYQGFPSTLCFSPNEVVVHGIPKDEPLKNGDIVSIDCGVYKDGYYGDAAYTFAIGEVDEDVIDLLDVTQESLYRAIDQAVAGNRVGDIGYAVQQYAEREHKYGVVRDLVGHGVGRELHEPPEVPNHGRRGRGQMLRSGLVIAIEPMITMGTRKVRQLKDKWTIVTRDRKPAAHFEHTVVVQKEGADILSDHSYIEDAVKNNVNLSDSIVEKSYLCTPKI